VVAVTGETYDTLDATLPELAFEDFPLMAGVDRYGLTMFNRLQLAPLAGELEILLKDAPPPRAALLSELIKICHKGSQLSDVQLWILGD
jgi:hypothetical protein